ncbi:hypothetical protein G6O69_16345 [Pseudenhygromyxa sp. WMMC2535]|uniref:DNA-directed RNA polymerase subunit alpha C-terminal domain-containing protein n=1 Tax=Pseudenhygromyxa sp. WMMC2535 TaxID=2712867 RepID=UPI001555F243|nr:DNA-directed RNA polymerase subunit alpha C-terminal domain-containing protein [Pseudenhygromyxa sp. WMMC2535]NVB39414.1 hypothetical protein [Pseudenhygromyxa sp. WMMC2535]
MSDFLQPSAVPQADRVERALEYAVLQHFQQEPLQELLFSGRDALYYRTAARLLELIDTSGQPTQQLVDFVESSGDPQAFLRDCFSRSEVGVTWARWAKTSLWRIDPSSAEAFLDALTQLAPATRLRRAKTLRSWLEALAPEDAGSTPEELRGLLLSRPLAHFHLSARTTNVFHRERLEYVHQAVSLGSEGLLELRGFGRTSLREFEAVLQREAPGETLDELAMALREGALSWPDGEKTAADSAPPPPQDQLDQLSWAELPERLPAHILELPIAYPELDLPTRILTHCTREDLQSVRDLVRHSEAELREFRGLGPTTLGGIAPLLWCVASGCSAMRPAKTESSRPGLLGSDRLGRAV